MHVIKVPDPVQLVHPISRAPLQERGPVGLAEFVVETLLPDPRFAADFKAICAGLAIQQAIGADVGGRVELEDAHYQLLRSVAENPQGGFRGWNPVYLAQLLPLVEAIMAAERVR